ncbi:MAG: excisionase family DNA-binding protein [Mycobacterium sp.]
MNAQPGLHTPSDQLPTTTTLPSLEVLRAGPPTLSVEEASRYLGVSRAYTYQMAREGRLPVIRLSEHRLRVSTIGLIRLLESGTY